MAKVNMSHLLSANAEQTKAIISKISAYPTVWSRVPSYLGYNTDLPPLLDKLIAEHLIIDPGPGLTNAGKLGAPICN
jgi:hypothetical protein